MAYIWENDTPDCTYRVSQNGISPYMEVWEGETGIIPVNIFYRLFDLLLPKDVADTAEKVDSLLQQYETDGRYQELADIWMHFIARLDRTKGIGLQEMLSAIKRQEIEKGWYGAQVREQFSRLSSTDASILLRYLAKYDLVRQRETMFDAVLFTLFPEVRFYYEHSTGILHIYLGAEKDAYHTNLYGLCQILFQDMGIHTEVMWKGEHFGIIGVEETMSVGQTALI